MKNPLDFTGKVALVTGAAAGMGLATAQAFAEAGAAVALADGAVLNELVIPAVRDGGAFTSGRGFLGKPQRNIRFSETFVPDYIGKFDKLDRLRQQVENGTLSLRVAATYPKEQAAAAHKQLEAGGTRGRLVIQF